MATHPLRTWRKQRGFTLRDLSARLAVRGGLRGIGYTNLSRIEAGLQPPTFELLIALYALSGGNLRPDDFIPADLRERVERAKGDYHGVQSKRRANNASAR